MMGLETVIHHILYRMGIKRAGGHNDQPQRIADQVDQRVIAHQTRIFGKDG